MHSQSGFYRHHFRRHDHEDDDDVDLESYTPHTIQVFAVGSVANIVSSTHRSLFVSSSALIVGGFTLNCCIVTHIATLAVLVQALCRYDRLSRMIVGKT